MGLSIDVVRHISFTHTGDSNDPSSSASFRIASLDAVDVERGETLASDAVSLLLPFFSCLEDSTRLRWVLTPARLFGARDDGLPVVLLRALASVAVICARVWENVPLLKDLDIKKHILRVVKSTFSWPMPVVWFTD